MGAETVSETTQVSAEASDNVAVASVQFYLDGSPLGAPVTKAPYAMSWNTLAATNGAHTLTAEATDTSGNVGHSAPVEVDVENPGQPGPCFVVDVTASAEGGRKRRRRRSPPPNRASSCSRSSRRTARRAPNTSRRRCPGAGLTWTLVRRANGQTGDAEIWTATATKALKKKRVKSKLAVKGYDQLLTVISVEMSGGAGASAAASAPTGTPSVSLMTSEPESLVYAVGTDPGGAVPRSLGSNQVLLHEEVNPAIGKTFWTQFLGTITGPGRRSRHARRHSPRGRSLEHGIGRDPRGRAGARNGPERPGRGQPYELGSR